MRRVHIKNKVDIGGLIVAAASGSNSNTYVVGVAHPMSEISSMYSGGYTVCTDQVRINFGMKKSIHIGENECMLCWSNAVADFDPVYIEAGTTDLYFEITHSSGPKMRRVPPFR